MCSMLRYLRGSGRDKLVLRRTCTGSAWRCFGNQTQPCPGWGSLQPAQEERREDPEIS